MTDYIVPLRFQGQPPDFKTLTRIKHPVQSILRNYFHNVAIAVKFEKRDRNRLKVVGFFGQIEELSKALAIANRTQKHHGPELARIGIDFVAVYEEKSDEEFEEELVTDQNLKDELSVLQELYQDAIDRQRGTEQHYESEITVLEKKLREHEEREKTIGDFINNITDARKSVEEELRQARSETNRWKKDYEGLSRIVEELSIAKAATPEELRIAAVRQSANGLRIVQQELQSIVDGANLEELLGLPQSLLEYANSKLNSEYSSEAEVRAAAEFRPAEPDAAAGTAYTQARTAVKFYELVKSSGVVVPSEVAAGLANIESLVDAHKSRIATFEAEKDRAEKLTARAETARGLINTYEKEKNERAILSKVTRIEIYQTTGAVSGTTITYLPVGIKDGWLHRKLGASLQLDEHGVAQSSDPTNIISIFKKYFPTVRMIAETIVT